MAICLPLAVRPLRLCIALFGLTLPAAAQAPLFQFVQISDPQAQTTAEWQRFDDVLRVIAEAGQPGKLLPRPIDFVIFAGDLTWGPTAARFIQFNQATDLWLTQNGIPYRCVPGNHDVNNSDVALYEQYIASADVWDVGSAAFTGHNGLPLTTSWKGLRFIGFNNSNPGWNTIPASDVAEIDARVSAAAALGENIFLLAHHPHNEKERLPLAAVLPEPSIVGYLRGHTNSVHVTRGLTGITNPNAWDVGTNSIVGDRALVYFEVFQSQLKAYPLELDSNPSALPAAIVVPLVYPLTPLSEGNLGFAGSLHLNARTDPTGSAPERKLWYQGGAWRAILWSDTAAAYRIHRLDTSTQTWTDTGPTVTTNSARSFDALVSGNTLYVASNVRSVPAQNSNGSPGQLFRYTFSTGPGTYALDAGFPVAVNDARSETLTIARDTTGTLWATWTKGGAVFVNHTQGGDDAAWASPLQLSGASGLADEETSAVVALGGKIGVLWPKAAAGTVSCALHADGDPDEVWTVETALAQAALVGDQIDLVEHAGQALAVVRAPSGELTVLERSLDLPGNGSWSVHQAAAASAGLSQPVLVVDQGFGKLRLFATGPTVAGQSVQGGGAIYTKLTDLLGIAFPHGRGTPVVQDGQNPSTAFATTARQPVDGASDLVVLASNAETERYWHCFDGLGSLPAAPVANFTGTPVTGVPPHTVQFTDLSSGAPTDWHWDFGDGQTSGEKSPAHVYDAVGTYTVSLRAASGAGENTFTRSAYVTVTAPPPVVTYEPIADARVSEGSPNTNAGLDTTLRVKTEAGSSFQSFLKFDLSSLPGTAQSAKLRLFCTDPSSMGGSVFLVANSSWTETGITWNNRPALPPSPLTFVGGVSAGFWVEFDVSGAFPVPGIYTLALAGGNTNSALYSSREGTNRPQLVINLAGGAEPPVADFVGSPLSGPAPLSVAFTDLSTNSPTGWNWDFGDGTGSTLRNPTHVYSQPGSYIVVLDVTNGAGFDSLTRNDYVVVEVGPPPPPIQTFVPVADAKVYEGTVTRNFGAETTIRVKSQSGTSYQSFLRFDASTLAGGVLSAKLRLFCTDGGSSGGTLYRLNGASWTESGVNWSNRPGLNGAIASLGSVAVNTWYELDVTSAVAGPGIVEFGLAGGNTNSILYASREGSNPPQLVVETGEPLPPVADFSGSPLSGNAPLAVTFSDLSTGATGWSWDFGDGGSSTVRNPVHSYAAPGVYTVTLGVTNSVGSDSRTRVDYVTVSEAGPPPPVQTLFPVADSRVNESGPNSNYGNDIALRIRSELGGSYHTYLRFDLSGIAGPVVSAKLRLFVTDGSDVGGVVLPTTDAWTETGITWNNKPGPSGPQIASAGSVAVSTWVEFDVTSAVTAGGLESFVIQSTSSNSCLYSSRESASNKPELVITSGSP